MLILAAYAAPPNDHPADMRGENAFSTRYNILITHRALIVRCHIFI